MEVWFFFCISMPWLFRLAEAHNIWIKKNGTCYMFSTFDLTWSEAEKFCRDMESNLTMVKSLEQHVFLRTHLIRQSILKMISANVSRDTKTYWIGAKYNKSLREYRWLDGSKMNVSGWGKNKQGCVYYSYFHGLSGRKKCKRAVGHFICENRAKMLHNSSSCPDVDTCAVRQSGYYGPLCQYSCPKGCANKTCDKSSGKCKNGCKKDLEGDLCQTCKNKHRFGSRCKDKCPKHCSTCADRRNCTACRDGFWGQTCKYQCDDMCLNGTCYFRTGSCSKHLSEQQNNKTVTTPNLSFLSSFYEPPKDISETQTENSKHSAECNNRTRDCSKDLSEQQKNKAVTTMSLNFNSSFKEASRNITSKKTVLNENSSSCDFKTENCGKPLYEHGDNTGTTASFNSHTSSDEPRKNILRNNTETSKNSPTCVNGTENCSKHVFDEPTEENVTATSFNSSSEKSRNTDSRNKTKISGCDFQTGTCSTPFSDQQTNKSVTTENLSFNSSSDKTRKNVSGIQTEVIKNTPNVSCQFNGENAVTVTFRLPEIISERSWALTFLVVGSCATFSLTFVAVVGIYCILWRRSRKKRGAAKRRKGKDAKSKKPGTKRNRKQKAASNVDDDSSFSDHLPDWQNVAFDHLFSQYREDNNRDSVGSIFPK